MRLANWDAFMPNSSRNDWEESVLCLFLEKSLFTPVNFEVSDVKCVLMTLTSLAYMQV